MNKRKFQTIIFYEHRYKSPNKKYCCMHVLAMAMEPSYKKCKNKLDVVVHDYNLRLWKVKAEDGEF